MPQPPRVALVLVSHSRALAEATAVLARQMTGDTVAIAIAAGSGPDGGELGTDATAIVDAVTAVDGPAGTVVLMDLGSALLSADLALELLDPDVAARVTLTAAPFVEGAVAAAALAGTGAPREAVAREARAALGPKAEHLGEAAEADTPPVTTAGAPSPADAVADQASADHGRTVGTAEAVIRDSAGLHARPAARLVALAAGFTATATLTDLTRGTGPAPLTSMVALARLGVRAGDRLRVAASGPDAEAAVAALAAAIESFTGTGDTPPPLHPKEVTPSGRAIPVAPGVALGPLVRLDRALPDVPERRTDDPAGETARLAAAIATARTMLGAAGRGGTAGDILAVQGALLDDPAIVGRAEALIGTERRDAASAWRAAVAEAAAAYGALDDPYLKAREADVHDIGRAVLRLLVGAAPAGAEGLRPGGPPAVLVVDDLAPSEAAQLDPATVLGVIDRRGGPTSHAAILLRAAGIPAVAGAAALVPAAGGTLAALDGTTGEVWIDPDAATQAALSARRTAFASARPAAPGGGRVTLGDGVEIALWANVSGPADARAARAAGAAGVGLLRTEMLFLDRLDPPSEDEQVAALRAIFGVFAGCPVVVRLLDAGGDKPIPYLAMAAEANPYLGVRGLRLLLARPEVLDAQLRAVLIAGHGHDVRIMLPMVTEADELARTRAALERVHAALAAAGTPHAWPVPLGIMVEVPASALTAARLAAHADFFSIGTNDLTQYTLAAERGHPGLGRFADAAHPAVLRLIAEVVAAGAAAGRPVSVCGEAAADPQVARLLVGLGVRTLSMGAASLAGVAQALDGASVPALAAAARAALAAETAEAARATVAEAAET
ncbi:phosphoenolpyruvate--protein phosphotransferase [Rhodoplanes serenus]|uniref:phosphoenolpyruvate--protein phosphotransferase n=1 Tax=Rhodoplanes serenus TaxID=200615 RepID=UPI00346312D9